MTAMRVTRRASRRAAQARPRPAGGSAARKTARRPAAVRSVPASIKRPLKPAAKPSKFVPPPQIPYRFCRAGWAVIVEKIPNAQGTRFVCPFCPLSHRVPGPVRGFRKMRRAQWVKLRRVEE